MTVISGLQPLATIRPPAARGRAGAAFHVASGARAEASAGVLAVDTPSFLALQEEAPNDVADREARRHSHGMLAALAQMQRGLLNGDASDALAHLASLARAAPPAADPRLAAVQKAIQVRAAVELARASATIPAAASV